MKHFTYLGNVDVLPLLLELERNPDVWNRQAARTKREQSPHEGLSDCWLRYREVSELSGKESYNEKFFPCVWYPEYHTLTEVKPILTQIMKLLTPVALGGTLISKIPPGHQVKPHTDACSWHARYYQTKVYTTLKSNPQVVNFTEGEPLVMRPGEVWTFDNLKVHSVENNGNDDRITLMTSLRLE